MMTGREPMAAVIADIVQPNEVLMLGAGATTFHVARRLAAKAKDITVIINDFAIASALAANPSIRILCCPGRYHSTEGYVFGTQTIASINSYEANRAIVGATGVGGRGINDTDEEAGAIYGAMVNRAAESTIAASHSKFEQAAPTVSAQWTEIDCF